MKKLIMITAAVSLSLLLGCTTNRPAPTASPTPGAGVPEAAIPEIVVPEGNIVNPEGTIAPNGVTPDGMIPDASMLPVDPSIGLTQEPIPSPEDMPPLGETITATNVKNVATKQNGVDDAIVLIENDEKFVVALKMRKGETLNELGEKSIREAIGNDKLVKITTDQKHYASAKSLHDAAKGEKIESGKVEKLFNEIK